MRAVLGYDVSGSQDVMFTGHDGFLILVRHSLSRSTNLPLIQNAKPQDAAIHHISIPRPTE